MPTSVNDPEYDALRVLMRDLRMKAGLTQVQMAGALQIGQSHVSKLERGASFFDVLLFARWCQACGVKPGRKLDELLAVWRGKQLPVRSRKVSTTPKRV